VGLLARAGKVRHTVCPFVSLDSIPLEPHFRNARQAGTITNTELDEGMFLLGLQAQAWQVPFLPTRVGLGSSVTDLDPDLRTVTSPYADGETLLAMPAIELDVALIHMNRGDQGGSGQYLGIDPYFDDLLCLAAKRRFMSVEKVIDTGDFLKDGPPQSLLITRLMTDGVVETPNGAHFTSCAPDYERDEAFQREYAATAKSDEAWDAFQAKYLDVPEVDYQAAIK
jgi:glutaconate CoA-transferase subunit A